MTHAPPKRITSPSGPKPADRWTDMPCPLCDADEMWRWIEPGARSSDCSCLSCGGVVSFREWTQAQGLTADDLDALARTPARAET